MPTQQQPLERLSGSDPFETPVIVGRDRQLGEIRHALTDPGPAVLVLQGAAGSGKSTMLEIAARRFNEAGGRVGPSVLVDDELTERGFFVAVRASHRLRVAPTLPEKVTSRRGPDPQNEVPESVDPLVAALRYAAPILLRLDVVNPNEDFARWFNDRFVPDVLGCDSHVVVLVAARPEVVEGKLLNGARIVAVPALQRDDVMAHFQRIGALLEPAAEAEELAELVAVATSEPALIDRLTRALGIVRRSPDSP